MPRINVSLPGAGLSFPSPTPSPVVPPSPMMADPNSFPNSIASLQQPFGIEKAQAWSHSVGLSSQTPETNSNSFHHNHNVVTRPPPAHSNLSSTAPNMSPSWNSGSVSVQSPRKNRATFLKTAAATSKVGNPKTVNGLGEK